MRVRKTQPFDRGTITKNIEAILKLEEDDERKLSSLHRVSRKVGWFVGTIYFLIIQAVLSSCGSFGMPLRFDLSIRIHFRFFPQSSLSKRCS